MRIELLSPINKEGDGKAAYLKNRFEAITSGTKRYEIDLLHETRSPLSIPRYSRDEGSQAYSIAVTDPTGVDFYSSNAETLVKGFNVDEPFPRINIPLLNDDAVLNFDLGVPYNETFIGLKCGSLIDYALPPDPKREAELGNRQWTGTAPPTRNASGRGWR